MRHFFDLIGRFRSDERGVFAVIFAVMAIVIVAMAGAVVDFVSLQQARNRAQVALDAATLALQPEIFKDDTTTAGIAERARALIVERIGDPRIGTEVTADDVAIDVSNGSLYIAAKLVVPTIFVRLVGVTELPATVFTEATRKQLALEVVMVLDNSGSMKDYDRMDYLKKAATCATYILFYDNVNYDEEEGVCAPAAGAERNENTQIGIVPFTTTVNIGPGYADASWMDRGGLAPKSRDNFDDDDNEHNDFTGNVDRLALFEAMSSYDWKGCMEARDYPYSVNDTEPDDADPDTLFTPAFAPDEPDRPDLFTGRNYSNNYMHDDPMACRATGSCTCTYTTRRVCGERGCWDDTTRNCSLTVDGATSSGSSVCSCGNYSSGTRTCAVSVSRVGGLSNRERQERLCKYTGTTSNNRAPGPNDACLDAEILPLTETPSSVTDAISEMEPEGGTNIHAGTIWGFHALSSTEPLTQGAPSTDEATSKVMIVMTDGENTFYTSENMNNARFNQFYGFPYNEREGDEDSTDGSMADRMDVLLAETCENAKKAGIEIFTIGLSTDDVQWNTPAEARALLTECATTPGNAHFPDSPEDLLDDFVKIANQLARLRLAR